MLFVTNWLPNSGKMKGYPDDIWTVEIWTVKTGLGLLLGLGLVMTVQFMTVQILTVEIKTGNDGTVSSPHFLAHVYCRQTAGWIKIPFGMELRLGPDHIVLDGNPAPP